MNTTTPTIVQRMIMPSEETPTDDSEEGPSAPALFWASTSSAMLWAVAVWERIAARTTGSIGRYILF